MITEYHLNVADAKSVGGSSWIQKSGAYIGTIKACYASETPTGATMFNLGFTTDSGENGIISMCTYKANKEPTYMKRIVDALLVVVRCRDINAKQGQYLDLRTGKYVVSPYVYDQIQGKKVGLLIQNSPEEYKDKDGNIKVANRLNLLTPFDAETRQNAKEILERTKAQIVDSRIPNLKDKELKKLAVETDSYDSNPQIEKKSAETFDEDDIPF